MEALFSTHGLLMEPSAFNRLLTKVKDVPEGYMDSYLKSVAEGNAENSSLKYVAENGQPVPNKEAAKGGNVIAIIPIVGVMQKQASYWYQSTSTIRVRAMIEAAEADPSVSAILFYVDSPGGTVTGTYELAETIKKAKKPTIAAVSDLSASAAVWVTSQCDEIYCTSPTGTIGSIDVLMVHQDYSKCLEELGIKYTYITTDLSGDKVLGNSTTPLSDEDKENIRLGMLNTKTQFESAVRKGRGTRLKEGNVFSGAVFSATQAKEFGLIDGIASLDKIYGVAAKNGRKWRKEKYSNIKTNHNSKMSVFDKWLKPEVTEDVVLTPDQATELYSKLDSAEKSASELQTKTSQLNAEVEAKNEEITKLQATISKLEGSTEAEEAKAELTKVVAEKAELETKVSDLETKVADLEAKVSASEEAGSTANETLAEVTTAKEEAEAKVSSLETKLAEAETKASDLEAKYKALAEEVGKDIKESYEKEDEEEEEKPKASRSVNLFHLNTRKVGNVAALRK